MTVATNSAMLLVGKTVVPINADLISRYWNMVTQKRGCWGWRGATHEFGYGILGSGVGNTLVRAHRVSWTIAHGNIPDGLRVLHKCDNPPCSNPKHLFLGTNKDNSRDMWKKGRASAPPVHFGETNVNAILTPEKVRFIRKVFKHRVFTREDVAWLLGITAHTVKAVLTGRVWRHV